MSAPKQSFDPPASAPIEGNGGAASDPYQQFFDHVGKTLEKLRQASELMDELGASPTTSEISTAWNAFRSKLREIV